MKMRIAIVVHGRFYAFDLARELLALGHDVVLFTNYPAWAVKKFGLPAKRVRSFLAHGIGSRVLNRVTPAKLNGWSERIANKAFGRWAARTVPREKWDAVLAFSGIAEELFTDLGGCRTLKVLQRGSSHIRTQRKILEDEQRRSGLWIQKPSDWIVAREEREYQLADVIFVLSTFADTSFQQHGIAREKLFHLMLGVSTNQFRASQALIDARCRRLLEGEPIRVLNVGTFALRKGALDWMKIIRELRTKRHSFRFVGPVAPDSRRLKREAEKCATFVPKQDEHDLPRQYEWGDIFCLPTLEDGFAVVLTQALASGLPLLTTTNCATPDLIKEGEQGWVVPIRSPHAIVERLRWCDEHREHLANMVRATHVAAPNLDWKETARQAEFALEAAMHRRKPNVRLGTKPAAEWTSEDSHAERVPSSGDNA